MKEEEIVLKRLKDTLAVLTGKDVITNLDFQIRNMVEDCIKVIEKQQVEIEKYKKAIDNACEILEDNNIDIDSIEELPEIDDVSAYDGLSIGANRVKINKIIQALKQHDKEIKELKEK